LGCRGCRIRHVPDQGLMELFDAHFITLFEVPFPLQANVTLG
jgi:hypothetical protein